MTSSVYRLLTSHKVKLNVGLRHLPGNICIDKYIHRDYELNTNFRFY